MNLTTYTKENPVMPKRPLWYRGSKRAPKGNCPTCDGVEVHVGRCALAQRLDNLGLRIAALDFVAERAGTAKVIEHIECYCWERRNEEWRTAARSVLVDLWWHWAQGERLPA
jgi:hypothetical protein